VSAILTDIDTSRKAEFVGQFPTKGWAPGVITIQTDAEYFSSTYWFELGSVTGVDKESAIPEAFLLSQNYPNPFNPSTMIEFALPERTFVKLSIFNTLGQEVETLVNEEKQAGIHRIQFNGSNLPSGVYFYRLETSKFVETKKMILMK
jgi:hypothetical protein